MSKGPGRRNNSKYETDNEHEQAKVMRNRICLAGWLALRPVWLALVIPQVQLVDPEAQLVVPENWLVNPEAQLATCILEAWLAGLGGEERLYGKMYIRNFSPFYSPFLPYRGRCPKRLGGKFMKFQVTPMATDMISCQLSGKTSANSF